MQYSIILSPQEIEVMSRILQEWPYRIVKPLLDNIAQQVDMQNQPKEKEENLTHKE